MNPDWNMDTEARIDRELKALPDLEAPRTLAPRVMAAIALRESASWYRRPWQQWPYALRVASLSVLILAFGVFCFAAWQLTKAAGYTEAAAEVRDLFSGVGFIWRILNVLGEAVVLIVKQMGTGLILGILGALAMGYAMCLALGTVCVRLAWARD